MLINDSATLKANIGSLDANFNWASISSYVQDVERDIISDAIGADALTWTLANTGSNDPVVLQALQLLQRAEAYLSIFKWCRYALYRMTDKSLYIAKNGDGAIISDKKLRDLKLAAEEDGYNFLDKALALMEANLVKFTTYRDGATRQSTMQAFILTAAEFNLQRSIDKSRLTFMSMMQIMLDVQSDYLPDILGAAYYPVYQAAFMAGTLTDPEKKLLPFIKKAVAMLTVSRAFTQLPAKITARGVLINKYNDNREYEQQEPAEVARLDYLSDDLREKGERKLNDLRNYLISNAGSFPSFLPPLTATVTSNDQDSGFFIL